MGVVIGVLIGYALGSKAGPEAWSELEDAWKTIVESEEVRDLVSGGLAIARDILEKRVDVLASMLGGSDEETPGLRAA
jgi:hypothetical protein